MNDDRAAGTKVRDRFDGHYDPRVVVPNEPVLNPDPEAPVVSSVRFVPRRRSPSERAAAMLKRWGDLLARLA